MVVLLGCGVCPHGWGWISVLWCFPGWGSLCLCFSGWWSWTSSLWRAVQCTLVGLGNICQFSIPLNNPSGFVSVRHIYFHSCFEVALSGYFYHHQPPTCSWNLHWCFRFLVLPWIADQSLLGRGMYGSFLCSLTLPLHHGDVYGLPSVPWGCPICHMACVHLLGSLDPPSMSWVLCALVLGPFSAWSRWGWTCVHLSRLTWPACQTPAPAARESAWRGEWCRRTMM